MPFLIGIQANCPTFGYMSNETAILLQEKLAGLQGSLRQLKEDKIQLQAEIDLLKKEKEILMKALDHFTALEDRAENLQNKNILLESQLDSLLKAIETMERDSMS
jgi:predicted  nucleic acid-binding Zn-ribbon protein